jgi:hypothetical protein
MTGEWPTDLYRDLAGCDDLPNAPEECDEDAEPALRR